MSTEEEETQNISIDNLFNNIIAQNFPSLGKERDREVPEAFKTQNR
jgi:hypothetical protein